MAINNQLIHFKKRSSFDRELAKGNILNTSIVFIADTQEIYTHGQYYKGSDPELVFTFEYIAEFEDALDAGFIADNSVVFIKETNQVWSNGNYYSMIPSDGYKGLVLVLKEDSTVEWKDLASMLPWIEDNLAYGVEWDINVSDPHITRIGNMSLHKTLPIQSLLKGCIAQKDKVMYWLAEDDWRFRKDPETVVMNLTVDGGYSLVSNIFSTLRYEKQWVKIGGVACLINSIDTDTNTATLIANDQLDALGLVTGTRDVELGAVLNGYDGTVRVYCPSFYIKSVIDGTKRRVWISTRKIDDGYTYLHEILIDAYRSTVLNTVPENMGYLSTLPVNSAISVVNTATYCRGGNGNRVLLDRYLEGAEIEYKIRLLDITNGFASALLVDMITNDETTKDVLAAAGIGRDNDAKSGIDIVTVNDGGSITKLSTMQSNITSYEFKTDYREKSVDVLAGKTIRRTILRDDYLYVLALDAAEAPYVYIINATTGEVAKTVSTAGLAVPTIPQTISSSTRYSPDYVKPLALSDIQLTDDGVLVGCAKGFTGLDKSNNSLGYSINIYKWANGTDGLPTGDPAVWFATENSADFYGSQEGNTFCYTGTSTAGTMYISARDATFIKGELNATMLTIANGALRETSYRRIYNRSGQTANCSEYSYGKDFTFHISPFGSDKIILTGSKRILGEITLPSNTTDYATMTTLKFGVLHNNSAKVSFFDYAGKKYMVTGDMFEAVDKNIFLTDLGKPRANLLRSVMRTYSRNAGSEMLNYYLYKNIFYWLYVIEYANFNCLEAYNEELTVDGYHLGGLGQGLTATNNSLDFNGQYPIIPCGYGNEFGNGSGIKIFTSSGLLPENRLMCRWRGFDNPFGDVNTVLDGIIIDAAEIYADGVLKYADNVYACQDPKKYADTIGDGYEKVGTIMDGGYIKQFNLGNLAHIIPLVTGGSSTTYKCDDVGITSNQRPSLKLFLVGGAMFYGAKCGFGSIEESYKSISEWSSATAGFRTVSNFVSLSE